MKNEVILGNKAKEIFYQAITHLNSYYEYPEPKYKGGVFKDGDLYIGFFGGQYYSEEFACEEEAVKFVKGEPCVDFYGQIF